MDRNEAARRFMFGWHLRMDPKKGEATWIAPEDGGYNETVTYAEAASLIAILSTDLDKMREIDGVLEYYIRDEEDEEETAT